eukprot:ANDGO_07656.mRNA.1 Cystathionine gamma-lyase
MDPSNHHSWGFGTKAIHVGQDPDPNTGAVITPISLSTTFAQHAPAQLYPGHYDYARSGNPTRQAFEEAVAATEHGTHAFAFGSGLGASTTVIHTLCKPGDHVIVVDDVYGGTQRLFRRCFAHYGIEFSFVDMCASSDKVQTTAFDHDGSSEFEKLVKAKPAKLIWIETPTNPTLKLVDIARAAAIAHEAGALLLVDNTFMSPYAQNPLKLGADIVLHSVTKYIGGHSDVVMGVVITGTPELAAQLKFHQNAIGATPSPFDCYLALRGLKTLHLRMRAAETNATTVSTYLESLMDANIADKHAGKIQKVIYPGLKSHPQHQLAARQMKCFGGMVTVVLRGGLPNAHAFLKNLTFFALAESLGGVESLAEHPASMTHASVPAEHRAMLGIDDGLVRLSFGIEECDDLLADVKRALDFVQ